MANESHLCLSFSTTEPVIRTIFNTALFLTYTLFVFQVESLQEEILMAQDQCKELTTTLEEERQHLETLRVSCN